METVQRPCFELVRREKKGRPEAEATNKPPSYQAHGVFNESSIISLVIKNAKLSNRRRIQTARSALRRAELPRAARTFEDQGLIGLPETIM